MDNLRLVNAAKKRVIYESKVNRFCRIYESKVNC